MNLLNKIIQRFRHNLKFELHYIRTALFDRYSEEEKQTIGAYKDKHFGQTGVIIANGPSLNDINLDYLKQFVTIGMNRIYLLYDKTDFRPTYYCLEDHMVAEDNADEISALESSTMFIPKDLSYCIKGNKNIHYTNLIRRYRGAKTESMFSTDFSQKAYWGGTVTYYALQLAYYLGFQKVYLVGLDHSYKKPEKLKGEKVVSREDDINHFDPRYFGKGKRWHAPKNLTERMELSYCAAKQVFRQAGRDIINATIKSRLSSDIFEKIAFEDIPERTNKVVQS